MENGYPTATSSEQEERHYSRKKNKNRIKFRRSKPRHLDLLAPLLVENGATGVAAVGRDQAIEEQGDIIADISEENVDSDRGRSDEGISRRGSQSCEQFTAPSSTASDSQYTAFRSTTRSLADTQAAKDATGARRKKGETPSLLAVNFLENNTLDIRDMVESMNKDLIQRCSEHVNGFTKSQTYMSKAEKQTARIEIEMKVDESNTVASRILATEAEDIA